ncbi:phosphatidylinositol-3,5-bisphosphate 3-phosphatase MTMR4 isoform X2 [Ambystoma mexicanum]|uniref:phosphatidylinositol-3,5-bisphosphate 3-phosphatase MTMR4 isoform X2 n=1 Tax=Ambystoma mexicanum TaxID=8296 RepID=UPI0037E87254
MGDEGPPSLEYIQAKDLFPQKELLKEEEELQVPFPVLQGEGVEYLGRADDALIAISNYRLHIKFKDSVINVPLRMIEAVESRDMFQLQIICKDSKVVRCHFSTFKQCQEWLKRLSRATTRPAKPEDLFAFAYHAWCLGICADEEDPHTHLCQPGDHVKFRFHMEVSRMGFDLQNAWRVSEINSNYKLCTSYPQKLLVPVWITDKELENVASFRSWKRIPVVVYRHQKNGAVIARCSQPEISWWGWRNADDEYLVTSIAKACALNPGGKISSGNSCKGVGEGNGTKGGGEGSNNVDTDFDASLTTCTNLESGGAPQKLLILDARSYTAAVANRAKGGGCECEEYYPNCEVVFMGMANIHSIRNSFHYLRAVCSQMPDPGNWLSALESTKWLQHLSIMLKAATLVSNAVDHEGRPVLVHCSDGWDRTPQIVSLAKILVDPYYRTLEGFQVLVETDWLDYGHKFGDRCGHQENVEDHSEQCPVFLQWLDCVHQLLLQFPCLFEFNQAFLVKLVQHTYSCLYGTFLANNSCEREMRNIYKRTCSVWSLLRTGNKNFHNLLYLPGNEMILHPVCHVRALQLWTAVYMPTSSPCSLAKDLYPPPVSQSQEFSARSLDRLTKTRSMDDLPSACDGSAPLTRTSSDPNINNHCQDARPDLEPRNCLVNGIEAETSHRLQPLHAESRGIRGLKYQFMEPLGMQEGPPDTSLENAFGNMLNSQSPPPFVLAVESLHGVDGVQKQHSPGENEAPEGPVNVKACGAVKNVQGDSDHENLCACADGDSVQKHGDENLPVHGNGDNLSGCGDAENLPRCGGTDIWKEHSDSETLLGFDNSANVVSHDDSVPLCDSDIVPLRDSDSGVHLPRCSNIKNLMDQQCQPNDEAKVTRGLKGGGSRDGPEEKGVLNKPVISERPESAITEGQVGEHAPETGILKGIVLKKEGGTNVFMEGKKYGTAETKVLNGDLGFGLKCPIGNSTVKPQSASCLTKEGRTALVTESPNCTNYSNDTEHSSEPCSKQIFGRGGASRDFVCVESSQAPNLPLDLPRIYHRQSSQSQMSEFSFLGSNWESLQGMMKSLPNGETGQRRLLMHGCCNKRVTNKPLRLAGSCVGGHWFHRDGFKTPCYVSSNLPCSGTHMKNCRYWTPSHSKQLQASKLLALACPSPVPPVRLDDDGLPFPADVVQQRLRQIEAGYKQEVELLRRQVRDLQLRLEVRHCCVPQSEPEVDYEDDFTCLKESDGSDTEDFYSDQSEDRLSEASWEPVDKKDAEVTRWVPDHMASHCFNCDCEFWLAKRRHHCRNCGNIFCASCCYLKLSIPDQQLYDPVLVCNSCYDQIQVSRARELMSQQLKKPIATASS